MTDSTGTVGSGTAPICSANRIHSQRPSTMPSGMPTTIPIPTAMDACHATAADSWRWTKPNTLSCARSRRQRRTDDARASASATTAASASPPASSSGVVPMDR